MTIGASDGTNISGFFVEVSTPFDKASVDFEDKIFPFTSFVFYGYIIFHR